MAQSTADVYGLDPLQGPPPDGVTTDTQLALLREVLALSQEAVALSSFESQRFLDCSPAAYERLGYSRDDYLALGPAGIQADAAKDAAWVSAQLQRMRQERSGSFESRHRCRDGSAIDVVVHYRLLELRGQTLILTLHRDRTELLRIRSRAERLNDLLLEAEELTQVGSWELIHATGELTWSEGTYRIFETSPATFSPTYEAFLAAVHPEDRELVNRRYQHSLEAREPYQVNHRLLFADGREKVVQERGSTTFDASGQPVRSIGTVQDISQLAAYEAQLERAAYIDTLTSLPNRQASIRRLTELVATEGVELGVFSLDLDDFQAFNDTFGPQLGDGLLQSVAALLLEALPPDSFLARLESDEFLIVQPCSREQLSEQAQEIQGWLGQARLEDMRLLRLPTVSMGACHVPSHSNEPLAVLQAANTALMEAKQNGKGSICLYSDAISERIRRRLELEAQLERAIARDQFHLVFQPQVNHQGSVVGAEVLLRWHDSNGTAIPPSVFIPLAEQSGQIHAISSWVFEQTCRQLQEWRREGLDVPKLAINLSAVQLGRTNSDLAGELLAILDGHGLDATSLELEITETALIAEPEQSRIDTLALSEAGFELAIDDFGTGYASLVTLHALPLDKIKIDTSFVQQLQSNATDHTIVKSTILMAHELGLVTLAEGVETEEQWRILRSLGCDLFQGYLFGVPMSAEAFRQRLLVQQTATRDDQAA